MKMTKKLACAVILGSFGLSAFAQTIEIKCSFPEAERNEFRWYIQPLEDGHQSTGTELVKDEAGIFSASLKPASDGFYKLYGSNQQRQLILPFYLPGEGKQQLLEIGRENNALKLAITKDNEAISAYNEFMSNASRKLWMEGKEMSSEQLKDLLMSYDREASRLIEKCKCAKPVSDYLKLWAYTSAYTDCLKLDFITKKSQEEIGFTTGDFLEKPEKMLDQPMARLFNPTNYIIMSGIPAGNVGSKLTYLNQAYRCDVIRKDVEDSVLLSYLGSFNYDKNFEEGLEELQALTENYQLNQKYLDKFKQRRFARKGSSFPEGVTLIDANGKEVNMEQFKGYYVYIDMWASWCGPCCKEVPHLQELEKTLKNEKVKFVSISTDTKVQAWKSKMEALHMEGNQFIDQGRKLGEALNITGIPHFLIYDKEGKLLYYKAPRPSQANVLRTLLEGLD